jgi:hypothetical protein
MQRADTSNALAKIYTRTRSKCSDVLVGTDLAAPALAPILSHKVRTQMS